MAKLIWALAVMALGNSAVHMLATDGTMPRQRQDRVWTSIGTPLSRTQPSFCATHRDPVGGGTGYGRIIARAHPSVVAVIDQNTSIGKVRSIIEHAHSGETIYFADDATVDLTGAQTPIVIPAGVTLASGRGSHSLGALITTRDYAEYNHLKNKYINDAAKSAGIFKLGGSDIRITGLRFAGPFTSTGSSDTARHKFGIEADGIERFELDNVELSGFPRAAVAVRKGSQSEIRIHHSYFHHNRQKGLGYGVEVDSAFAMIYANLFDHNRHDIAGNGVKMSGYEAFCNVVNSGGTSHNFDMHGGHEDKEPQAGRFIYIHHNTFNDEGDNREASASFNIVIRGKPDIQCRIEYNVFAKSSVKAAIQQRHVFGNLLVWNNLYAYDHYLGWYVAPRWENRKTENFVKVPSTNDALMASMGDTILVDYAFGDFDGDGRTEVIKRDGGVWYTIPIELRGNIVEEWAPKAHSSWSISSLGFADFDSHKTTDVFKANGATWEVSDGAMAGWRLINTSVFQLDRLVLADFDADGVSDVFRSDGRRWYISWAGTSSWDTVNTSDYPASELAVGDFNGDGKADVFVGNGKVWKVSWAGRSKWDTLTPSKFRVPELTFGDFDGDGLTDVMAYWGGAWRIALKGRNSWKEMRTTELPTSTLRYGQF